MSKNSLEIQEKTEQILLFTCFLHAFYMFSASFASKEKLRLETRDALLEISHKQQPHWKPNPNLFTSLLDFRCTWQAPCERNLWRCIDVEASIAEEEPLMKEETLHRNRVRFPLFLPITSLVWWMCQHLYASIRLLQMKAWREKKLGKRSDPSSP